VFGHRRPLDRVLSAGGAAQAGIRPGQGRAAGARHDLNFEDLLHAGVADDLERRLHEGRHVGHPVLQEVADPLRVLAEEVDGLARLHVLGEHEHAVTKYQRSGKQ